MFHLSLLEIRVIKKTGIDLSWPKYSSVNAGKEKNSYLGTDFALTFPSVDHITKEIKRLGTAALRYASTRI